MEYWRGLMDWEIKQNWICETCGVNAGLTWGLVHAECRCNKCHTPYGMRDKEGNIVTEPMSKLKDEYKKAARLGYEKFHKPIEEFTNDEWNMFINLSEREVKKDEMDR